MKGGAKPAKAHDASRTKCCRNLAQIITIIMYSTVTVQAKVPLGSFWLTERLFTYAVGLYRAGWRVEIHNNHYFLGGIILDQAAAEEGKYGSAAYESSAPNP